ncbi:hypothetical protein MY3296_008634 [Beauveria thailandica]
MMDNNLEGLLIKNIYKLKNNSNSFNL